VSANAAPEDGRDPAAVRRRIEAGGAPRYHAQAAQRGKLFARRRLELLFDGPPEVEDGLYARALSPDLPADAVITGLGRVDGRPVAFMAADSTVKAGSWGSATVEKILRIQETAERLRIPLVYLVDSAGARITDQVEMFPGRRHAGRIFYQQVRLSGVVPQLAILFGPSPAGAAYVPALCDLVVMVEGNASAYLGSPRMAEMVIGERVSLEEMGGARMHCTKSGLGDLLAPDEPAAIAACRRYLSYLPTSAGEAPPGADPRPPAAERPVAEIVPADPGRPFDMLELVQAVVDEGSLMEVRQLFAPELICAFARVDGRAVAILANQPKVKGGTLFVDSADKGARFVTLANAYGLPLVFLADVPGFMIGSRVEAQGIIRHGAQMIAAVSEATVPKVCVIVRKCYGAGLYAMAGPAFGPDAVLALPTAQVAVMGPEAAVNAVHFNHLKDLPAEEREREAARLRREYAEDIDLMRLADALVVDHIVAFDELRPELVRRLGHYVRRREDWPPRRTPIHPL
jgi:acetyl-CoA carboxylase carboxyltransferase component